MPRSRGLILTHGVNSAQCLAAVACVCSLLALSCSGGSSSSGGASGDAAAGSSGMSGAASGVAGTPNGGGGTSAGGTANGGASGGNASGVAGAGGSSAGGMSGTGGGMAGAPVGGVGGGAQTYPTPLTTHLTIGTHDPSLIHVGSKYYLFATGGLLNVRSSSNFTSWSNAGSVFASMPAWIATELGQAITDLWAPDISFFNGSYHVYYAGSVFGSNHSVIGLATNTTLDSSTAGYQWQDHGLILESNKVAGADDWNAIDPNLTADESGQLWLVFGSFWSGIKLRQVDASTGKLSTSNPTLYALATNSSIEAASITSHNGFYYLFVSYGACCKNVNSTYSTMVGRATAITGPYTNKAGAAMLEGNAETMLKTDGRYIGPGGGTAFRDGSLYYYAYHYYDGNANGASYLMLRPIQFDTDDWPVFGAPLWQ
jgi:arabinan endo-1,5-alpha-L-arabinosidase